MDKDKVIPVGTLVRLKKHREALLRSDLRRRPGAKLLARVVIEFGRAYYTAFLQQETRRNTYLVFREEIEPVNLLSLLAEASDVDE